jgi:hypothetical protein
VGLAALVLTLCGAARAQFEPVYRPPAAGGRNAASLASVSAQRMQSVLVRNAINRARTRSLAGATAGRRGARNGVNAPATTPRTTPVAPTPAADAATTFRPVSPPFLPGQLAAETAQTPAERKEQQAFFAQCLTNYESLRRGQGLPVKDVALAVSYLIGVSYNVYHGGDALTAAQGDALRAQVREGLASDPGFRRLSNREKQEMYELTAIVGEFLAVNADAASQKGNRQLAEMAREMAKDNLERLLGVPASQVRITDHGLEF